MQDRTRNATTEQRQTRTVRRVRAWSLIFSGCAACASFSSLGCSATPASNPSANAGTSNTGGSSPGAGGSPTSSAGASSTSSAGGSTSGNAGAGAGSGTNGSGASGGGTGGNSGAAGASGNGGASAGTAGRGGAANGGNAGVAGGTTGGGAGLGGVSLCTPGKYLLCENFEATAVGAVPSGWTRRGAATVAIDQAARGTHSLKIAAATNGERRITISATPFGAAHFGRIFYRVQTPPPLPPTNSDVIHSTIVALQGNGPTIGAAEYRVVDTVENFAGMHQYLYNVQPTGSNEFGKGAPYNWRYDGNWHCAEWQIDASTQTYRFFIDNTEVTQIAINNGAGNNGSGANRSEIPMSFSEIRVGWNNYQAANPGFVAWVDEIAIHSSRIGCGN